MRILYNIQNKHILSVRWHVALCPTSNFCLICIQICQTPLCNACLNLYDNFKHAFFKCPSSAGPSYLSETSQLTVQIRMSLWPFGSLLSSYMIHQIYLNVYILFKHIIIEATFQINNLCCLYKFTKNQHICNLIINFMID